MTVKEILQTTHHRPWPLPVGSWRYYQEWNNAVFLHWKVGYEVLKKLLPPGLEPDLLEGNPWVSLVAFTMQKIRPAFLPSFKPVSDFDEINIRTYVRSGNLSGVYFLSIEAGNKLSCKLARGISGLPYRYSEMRRQEQQYTSRNAEFEDSLSIRYTTGNELPEKTVTDRWLTERYALFQEEGQHLNKFDIHHVEWPVQTLSLESLEVNYSRFQPLINNTPDCTHYSRGVQVMAWGKEKKKFTK